MNHLTVRWLGRAMRIALAAALAIIVACTHSRDGVRQVDEDNPTVTYQYSDSEGLLNASFQAEIHCRQFDAWPHVEEVEERSEEHTSELQSRGQLVCRLLLEKKK